MIEVKYLIDTDAISVVLKICKVHVNLVEDKVTVVKKLKIHLQLQNRTRGRGGREEEKSRRQHIDYIIHIIYIIIVYLHGTYLGI